jgi:hypothetical protein
MPNVISQIKSVPVEGPKGSTSATSAMMIAVDIDDLTTADSFVTELAEQFKLHRMTAPPETSMMLITILGDLTASQFAARWQAIEARDPVVRAFMSLMTVADVIQGTASGEVLERVSLVTTNQ